MTDSQVSRRGMLKWAGALAAAGVVGVGLGFGGDILVRPGTTTTAQMETNVSTATVTATKTNTQMATQTQIATLTQPPTTQTETATETATKTATQTATQTVTQTSTTTSVQQPVTLSYVPPLSPQVQSLAVGVVNGYINQHSGEQVYGPVGINFMGGGLVSVHVRNGVITSIDANDGGIHANTGREDASASSNDILGGYMQWRGAQMSYAFPASNNAPDRILYPMMRTSDSARADQNGKFMRVTWTNALDAIAAKIQQVSSKYGLYSIWNGSDMNASASDPGGNTPTINYGGTDVIRYTGSEVGSWGHTSGANEGLTQNFVFGQDIGEYSNMCDGEIEAIPKSSLIVTWGNDPAVTCGIPWQGIAYYFMLAHEQKIPHICIDSHYSMTAEILADQWIPIRPGTDMTMMLAVANVLFKEDLIDHAFVNKFIEPTGLQKWKDYVLGKTPGYDGAIDRTPEWAAPICGVPAQSIRAFAELYGAHQGYSLKKPCFLVFGTAPARTIGAENPTRAALYLQLLTGNVGVPGGNVSFAIFTDYSFKRGWGRVNAPALANSRTLPSPAPVVPCLFKHVKSSDAILLRKQYDSNQITQSQYNMIIGSQASNPCPNLKMVTRIPGGSGGALALNGQPNINKTLQAIQALEMYVIGHWHMTPEARSADIVLPMADCYETNMGFVSGSSSAGPGIAWCPKLIDPQGEARPAAWVWAEIASRLGYLKYWEPNYVGKTWADWETMILAEIQNGYNTWQANPNTSPAWSGITIPSFQDATKKGYIFCPGDVPSGGGYALKDAIETGKAVRKGVTGHPFWTKSGLAEFYSDYLAQGDAFLQSTKYGGHVAPMAVWEQQDYGMFDPLVSQYPLRMTECHPRPRGNVATSDSAPLMRDEIFRHAVEISVADATARGIKDNDLVRVYNDIGEMVLPAYVTSRILPGVVHIYAGAWYNPDKAGIDRRGSTDILIHDHYAPVTEPNNSLVEVEKF